MGTIAVYSLKGGVGKTTIAVNLAWTAATISARRTLLWDLDPQGGSTFLIGNSEARGIAARPVFARDVPAEDFIHPSTVNGVDLLPADRSLREVDHYLFELAKKKRLAKLTDALGKDYDRIILDCPPGLTEISEQILRAADLIIVPVIPSPLSTRAFEEVTRFLDQRGGKHAPVMPVYSMVDARRALHREALEQHADWPAIPMASSVEQMAVHRAPLGSFARGSGAAQAFSDLWQKIERKLSGPR